MIKLKYKQLGTNQQPQTCMVLAFVQEKAKGSSGICDGCENRRNPKIANTVFTGTYEKPILEQELKLGGVLPN